MRLIFKGMSVHVERYGRGGTPLLLLHGWGGRIESLQPLIRDFSTERQVVALDFPGHGDSALPAWDMGVPDFAEMTAFIISQLDIGPCDVVAHSFGGRVTLALAAQYPQLVRKILLTGVPGLRPDTPPPATMKTNVYKALRAFASSETLLRVLGEKRVDSIREWLIQRFGSEDYRALPPAMRPTFVKIVGQDLTPYLPVIKAATLLIWGDRDSAAPLWMARRMEAMIPSAELVIMPGAGHFVYLDKYQEFMRVSAHFLE